MTVENALNGIGDRRGGTAQGFLAVGHIVLPGPE